MREVLSSSPYVQIPKKPFPMLDPFPVSDPVSGAKCYNCFCDLSCCISLVFKEETLSLTCLKWIFEEIQQGQYIDKSATERLALVEQYARYGLETWGSDEMGVGITRRFLLEWLSFAYRYIPVGILEHLPPSLQDRPPAWRGRNELETLLGSDNFQDWIKIR